MKKHLCIVLTAAIVATQLPAAAESSFGIIGGADGPTAIYVGSTPSAALSLSEALSAVKSRVSIPQELKNFQSTQNQNDSGSVSYYFEWNNDDYSSGISVTCSDAGHITSYNYYDRSLYGDSANTPLMPRAQAVDSAEKFIRQLIPEAFADESDILIYDEDSSFSQLSRGGSRFSVCFNRFADGTQVFNNRVLVSLIGTKSGAVVNSVSVMYDFNAQFDDTPTADINPAEAYKASFPAEAVYKTEYDYSNPQKIEKTEKLIYRIKDNKAGFISAADGAIVEPDRFDYDSFFGANKAEAASASGGGAASRDEVFTEEELAELENVASLKSAAEIERTLRAIPELKLDDFGSVSTSIYKSSEQYFMRLRFTPEDDEDYSYASITVNAATGQLKTVNSYRRADYQETDNSEMTDSQKLQADGEIEAFLAKYAGAEFPKCVCTSSVYDKNTVSKTYTRMENGFSCIDETILVRYNAAEKTIESFNLNIDTALSFPSADGMISSDAAYESIYKFFPLTLVYAPVNGKYIRCYTLKNNAAYVTIDAFTGENQSGSEDTVAAYTDISGHWCEDAVILLAEYGIYLPGEQFCPDSAITQEDLLRLFGAGVNYPDFARADKAAVYSYFTGLGVITDEEKNDTSPVTREKAFSYLVRIAGYGKIAAISGIYKVDFADGGALSEDMTGAAAILSGLGVIAGHGGYVRPKDFITRAEAAVMLYNYLNCGNI